MSALVTAIPTGIAAFTATNLDDLVILTLLFSQPSVFRPWHIVVGQYLGFSILLIASLPGFSVSYILPRHWIGLVGLVPIAIGLSQWLNGNNIATSANPEDSTLPLAISPQIYSIAAITIANGGDNIGIYMPLFASSNLERLLIIITIFFLLIGVWCYASYRLSTTSQADVLARYANPIIPLFLIGLGVFIVWESQSLTPLALLASCLCLIGLVKKDRPAPEARKII